MYIYYDIYIYIIIQVICSNMLQRHVVDVNDDISCIVFASA